MSESLLTLAKRVVSNDFFLSAPFWLCFVAAAIVYRLAPPRLGLKQWLLLAANAGMLLTLPQFSFLMMALLGCMIGFTYAIASVLNSGTVVTRRGRLCIGITGIASIVLVLAFFKYRFIQELVIRKIGRDGLAGSDVIFLIGISYSSFKAMHFIIEGYRRAIKEPRLLKFANYILFFPAFISGPINRYNHFLENSDIARHAGWGEDLRLGSQRIIHGLFKKLVLVTLVLPYTINHLSMPLAHLTWWQTVIGLYALALYFYFDFSGYTDLAIGTGRIMGFVLPENFNFPFFKKNIQQLWASWHMSLTSWLTDYIYWPVVRKLRGAEILRGHPVLLSNIAIILTFAICGLWHGNSLNFLAWGIYQGIGIAIVNVYQSWKRKVRNTAARKYFASRLSYAIGLFVTFNFFSVGQALFVFDTGQIKAFLSLVL